MLAGERGRAGEGELGQAGVDPGPRAVRGPLRGNRGSLGTGHSSLMAPQHRAHGHQATPSSQSLLPPVLGSLPSCTSSWLLLVLLPPRGQSCLVAWLQTSPRFNAAICNHNFPVSQFFMVQWLRDCCIPPQSCTRPLWNALKTKYL